MDKTTRVVVEAKAKGIEQLDRGIVKVHGGLRALTVEFAALDKVAVRATKQIAALNNQFQRLGKTFQVGTPLAQLNQMATATGRVTQAVNQLNTSMSRLQGVRPGMAAAALPQAGGGGGMGGAAGGGAPPSAPAGAPTTGQVAKGTFLGHVGALAFDRLQTGASSLLSTPFTGAQGLLGAIGAVPIVGGPAAGMLSAGMGAAGQYLARQQQQYGMRYLAGPGGLQGADAAAVRRAMAGVAVPAFSQAGVDAAREQAVQSSMSRAEGSRFDQAVQARAMLDRQRKAKGQLSGPAEAGEGFANWLLQSAKGAVSDLFVRGPEELPDIRAPLKKGEQRSIDYETQRSESVARQAMLKSVGRMAKVGGELAAQAEEKRQRDAIRNAKAKRERAARRADQEAREAPFRAIEDLGVRFGLGSPEALSTAEEFLSASGRTLGSIRTQQGARDLASAMGARSTYNIGGGAAGLIARGMGAGMMHGESLDAIIRAAAGAARGRGLAGADITQAVQEIADRVKNWEQSGLPIANDSLEELQQGFTGAVGGIRGSIIGAGFLTAQQQKSLAGPSSDQDIYELAGLYGYRPGSGAKGLKEALLRQEGGKIAGSTPEEQAARLRQFMGAGTGDYGELMGFVRARAAGINVSRSEFSRMGGVGAAGAVGGPDTDALAEAFAPGEVQRQKALENQRMRQGGAFVGTAQSLEAATLKNIGEFGKLGPDIKRLADWAGSGGQNIMRAIEHLDEFIKIAVEKLGAK